MSDEIELQDSGADDAPVEGSEPQGDEPQVFEIPSEGRIKFGDKEFDASEFRTRFVPQDRLQEIREKDKAKLQEREQALRQQYETAYRQALAQLQQQQQGQQSPQGANPQQQIIERIKQRGYTTAEDVQELLELQSKQSNGLDPRLTKYLTGLQQYVTKLEDQLSNVQGTMTQKQLDNWTSQMAEKFPELTEDYIDFVFRAHEPESEDEDLFESLEGILEQQNEAMRKKRAARQKAELEEAKKQKSRLPGVGGEGSPDKPLKAPVGRDAASEITEMFFGRGTE